MTAAAAPRKASSQNRANQEAILRLLDEISNLANGDLTVRAQVTEHMTGAIADSINYTIDELRRLVTGITGAAAAGDDRHPGSPERITGQLLQATQKQAVEIQGTGQSVDTDGAVDERGVEEGGRLHQGRGELAARRAEGRRRRCRTRSAA